MMQTFASATIAPRTIAWLIPYNDWTHLEKVVAHTCEILGGYYNIIIPLGEDGTPLEGYAHVLAVSDPDIIVLPPGATREDPRYEFDTCLSYARVEWEEVPVVILPYIFGGLINKNVGAPSVATLSDLGLQAAPLIAVEDILRSNESRRAFISCGDTLIEDTPSIASHPHPRGRRESFFLTAISAEMLPNDDLHDLGTALRSKLNSHIPKAYHFPMENAVAILDQNYTLQEGRIARSLLTLTRFDVSNKGVLRMRASKQSEYPLGYIILVSENFGVDEAAVFWNLRASDQRVVWLSFMELETEFDAILDWLRADFISAWQFYFAAPQSEEARLEKVVKAIWDSNDNSSMVMAEQLEWSNLLRRVIARPEILTQDVAITSAENPGFLVQLPQDNVGLYTITLKWDGLRLPSNSSIAYRVSNATIALNVNGKRQEQRTVRITNERHARFQTCHSGPLHFKQPSLFECITSVLTVGKYRRIALSGTAPLQTDFVNRAGNLTEAVRYFATEPYRTLLTILADGKDKNKPGWLLENPKDRRGIDHFSLLRVLDEDVPYDTERYFKRSANRLPAPVVELLEKGLLERGFVLQCFNCAHEAWYPIQTVGKAFICELCYREQTLITNPTWLYKLAELTIQGLRQKIEVPLLAAYYFQRKFGVPFEWLPDANVYWLDPHTHRELSRNLDIAVLSQGRLFIGEAKVGNSIENDQFDFYAQLSREISLEGVVFATAQSSWNKATEERINQLRESSKNIQVISLQEKELYTEVQWTYGITTYTYAGIFQIDPIDIDGQKADAVVCIETGVYLAVLEQTKVSFPDGKDVKATLYLGYPYQPHMLEDNEGRPLIAPNDWKGRIVRKIGEAPKLSHKNIAKEGENDIDPPISFSE